MRDEQTNEQRTLKIELLSQWKLEAESRNLMMLEERQHDDYMIIIGRVLDDNLITIGRVLDGT